MRVTLFPDIYGKRLTECQMTLAEVAALIQRTRAEALPGLKLAAYGSAVNSKGVLRHDANVTAVSGVEGDYDAGEVEVDEAVRRLAGIEALVYTTKRHSAERPRWRVLAPFSAEVGPDERAPGVSRLNAALGGVLAPESWVLSQYWMYGHQPVRVELVEGRALDECGWLVGVQSEGSSHGRGEGEVSLRSLRETLRAYPQTAERWSPEESYADTAWKKEFERLSTAVPGTRGSELYRAAASLGSVVAVGWISAEAVVTMLCHACEANGLARQDGADRVLREMLRGLQAGLATPHPGLRYRPAPSLTLGAGYFLLTERLKGLD